MNPAISVIILSWNGKQHLPACLDALAGQSFRDFETVLVDNGSTDGTACYLREHYPWVRMVGLPENVGFAGGNNRALAECRGRYIVTLNNDTKAEPDFLAELLRTAQTDPGVGMVAAKMLNFYEKGRLDSVGVGIASDGLGRNIGCNQPDLGQYDGSREVFGACAGAALYRRDMLDQVGFFDDGFFAYYEDLDLCRRIHARYQTLFYPRTTITHEFGRASFKSRKMLKIHIASALYYFNKWGWILDPERKRINTAFMKRYACLRSR